MKTFPTGPIIAPSILASDFARLGEQVTEAAEAGAKVIHIDVMDGRFVPNISIGMPIVAALKPIAAAHDLILDVHLMIVEPEKYVEPFAEAGADVLTVHIEVSPHIHRTVQAIHAAGMLAGVALNPGTQAVAVSEILPDIDLVLPMSVNPGFGGQSYIESTTAKISQLAKMLKACGSSAVIEVDGGIKSHNAGKIAAAGASILVSGSGVFSADTTIAENLKALNFEMATGHSRTI